jgi:hypothetical protein
MTSIVELYVVFIAGSAAMFLVIFLGYCAVDDYRARHRTRSNVIRRVNGTITAKESDKLKEWEQSTCESQARRSDAIIDGVKAELP